MNYGVYMRFKSVFVSIAALAALASTAVNATELITNGNFETGDYGQIDTNGRQLQGWHTTGYNFLYSPSNVDTTGTPGIWNPVALWGPNNGAANGLGASPAGGNFVAADGAFNVAPLTQTVNGLVVGQKYNLSFYWAGAQQYTFNGPTTEQWKVSFGNETYSTAVLDNANHGFTGWKQEIVTFTATSTSELLSFLAVGTPDGLPPFSLLDGVSMTAAVPEPGTFALMGLGMLGFAARHRKSKQQ